MSPQLAVDVSLLLSATAQPVVQDLLDANKLVRDMRRSAAQSLLRLRGISWSLLRGPMRAIVPDQIVLSDRRLCDNSGFRKAVRTWSRRRGQRDGLAILQALEENCWIEQR